MMRKFSRAYGYLAAGVLISSLFIGTAFGQGTVSEGDRWLNLALADGGLKTPKGLPDLAGNVPRPSGTRLDAFRNAFYFHYAKPGGGGLDLDLGDSLELSVDHVDGSNPVQTFQKYQTVFIDRFPAKFNELVRAGKKPGEAFGDATEYATQQASNVVGSAVWDARWKAEPATNVEQEVLAWATRGKISFGGGLDATKAASLARSAAMWATRGGEGLDRMTTHKAVAVRSLFLFASATIQGGGLGYGEFPDRSIALINEFLPLDHSVTRVEIFRNSFHRHLLDLKAPGRTLSTFDNALKLAKEEAFGAKIEPDVRGGLKITPAASTPR